MARKASKAFDDRQILVSRLKRAFVDIDVTVDWGKVEMAYAAVQNEPQVTKAELQAKIAELEAKLSGKAA